MRLREGRYLHGSFVVSTLYKTRLWRCICFEDYRGQTTFRRERAITVDLETQCRKLQTISISVNGRTFCSVTLDADKYAQEELDSRGAGESDHPAPPWQLPATTFLTLLFLVWYGSGLSIQLPGCHIYVQERTSSDSGRRRNPSFHPETLKQIYSSPALLPPFRRFR